MNEELNLVEILKNVPEGTKLWSDVHGEITFVKIQDSIGSEILCISKISNCSFSSKGEFYSGLGQCILFPSKTQRDWSKFKVDLPEGTKVMCSNGFGWSLRYYAGNKTIFINSTSPCTSLQNFVPTGTFFKISTKFNSSFIMFLFNVIN